MATNQTMAEVMEMLLDSPLANKPKPRSNQTDTDVTIATTRIFRLVVGDLDDGLLMAATIQVIASEVFFPAPAKLRATALSLIDRADDIPDSFTAWSQIKGHMQGSRAELHPLALQAIDALGGLAEFGRSDIGDEPSWRAQFIRAFDSLKARQDTDRLTIPAVAGYLEKRKELAGNSVGGLISATTAAMKI